MLFLACAAGCSADPEPFGAVPDDAQVKWQQMEMNMFMHFGPNTFSGLEWGKGDESEDIFNPEDLDCAQWAATASAAGFKGIIITAKHHDGFCLWPNPQSRHTVRQSSWRDGQGDVLKELSEACREKGLGFGVYVSPWDRNDPRYGTPEYNGVFVHTLESVLGDYGPVFEQWFDGACGEGPDGRRQVYDWPLFNYTVERLQPQAVIFSDVGPGCRWVGNEKGIAGLTNWSTLDTDGFAPGKQAPSVDTLRSGNVGGASWIPAETDVSIRPGWFWRESENDSVKDLQTLLRIYYESVGRNSLLLLNVPPDTRGHIHEIDSTRLMEFRSALDTIFRDDLASDSEASSSSRFSRAHRADAVTDGAYDTYWAAAGSDELPCISLDFKREVSFNRVLVQEYIPLGQRIASFTIEARDSEGNWTKIGGGTTVGYKRIVLTPLTSATALRIKFDRTLASPVISQIEVYLDELFEQVV